jgi:tricorn protease
LQKETRSPLIAFSDREIVLRQERQLNIDVENIRQRIVPLPVPPHNTINLSVGKPGVVFALGKWVDTVRTDKPSIRTLYKLDIATLKLEKFIEDAREYRISTDGSKLLVLKGDDLSVVSTDLAPAKEGGGKLDLSGLLVNFNPRSEWKQIYDEVWRLERDYLYYPDLHGRDFAALKEHYARFLPNVVTRGDLNVLMREMLSHLSISHMENGGGDIPPSSGGGQRENIGVLGADFKPENGRYKITRLYQGDNSIPALRGALTQPGTDVKEGDYLLAIDDKEVSASENLYKYLVGKAGKLVRLKVSADSTGKQARVVEAVPMTSDKRLRDFVRVESNRRLVSEKSQGKLGYIYLPNVNVEGFDIFIRDFYSQLDKKGLIIDQRFNSGGYASDFIIEALKRTPLAGYKFRDGEDIIFPADVIQGPKVMLITEFAGSGGDSLAWFFKEAKLGSLVGTTTRGYGIGHYINLPDLIDGGYVRAPHRAFYNLKSGKLETENAGVSPDYPVEWTPVSWKSGRDPQLEKAIEVALKQISGQDKKLKVLNK